MTGMNGGSASRHRRPPSGCGSAGAAGGYGRLWKTLEGPYRAPSPRFPQPTTTSWKTLRVFLSPLEKRALPSNDRARFPTAPQPRRRRGSFLSNLGLTPYRGTHDGAMVNVAPMRRSNKCVNVYVAPMWHPCGRDTPILLSSPHKSTSVVVAPMNKCGSVYVAPMGSLCRCCAIMYLAPIR